MGIRDLLPKDLLEFALRTGGALVCLTALSLPALALNPAYRISQYAHSSWRSDAGLQAVVRVKQTPDGYLWLATRGGLVRFDGVLFTTFKAGSEKGLESSTMQDLVIDPDGSMWVATLGGGIAHYRSGVFRSYTSRDGLPSNDVNSIYRDSHGVLWIGTRGGAIARMVQGRFENLSLGIPAGRIDAFLEDADQSLWIATFGHGLFRLRNGKVSSFSVKEGLPDARVTGLYRDHSGRIWTAGWKGISYWNGTSFVSYPAVNRVVSYAESCIEDRDGNLWIASSTGLVRVHDGEVSRMDSSSGISSNVLSNVFEDREGNLWVGTRAGIDRFSDGEVRTFSVREGLFPDPGPIVADNSGGVWTVSSKQVARIASNKINVWPIMLPAGSIPFSMLSDADSGFFVGFNGGLKHWSRERHDTESEMSDLEVRSLLQARNGEIWIGTAKRGLLRWRPSSALSATKRPIKISGATLETVVPDESIYTLAEDHAGVIWAGSADGGGIYRVAGEHVQHFGTGEGLRSPNVYTIFVDSKGDVWIGSTGGLSWFQQGQIRTVNSQQGLPSDQVFAILDDAYDRLWFAGYGGITAIEKKDLAEWAAGQRRRLNPAVYRGTEPYQARFIEFPNAARSTDGHLWFCLGNAISEVTPAPPASRGPTFPVLVEGVSVDGLFHPGQGRTRIPPGARSIQFRYTALTLSKPETVRFRYRLEGIDSDWVDADTRRLAFYNNLKPGAYQFRVAASAGEEQWLESAPLALEQLPFFYQTAWFMMLASSVVLSLAFLVHRLHVRQITREFNARLEGRVSERTRVARELHDTLLQSFQGVLLKFSTIKYIMRNRPDEAEEALERYIDDARAAIIEGREAVQGMRSSMVVVNDLARTITQFGEGLAADLAEQNRPEFRVYVEGKSRALPPLVRDEVYKIACESLRNAFRHAQARRIEVQIRYGPRRFRLHIVDNGKGIDPAVLSAGGRAGHHGLPGLNERAELAGGKLLVWSQLESGTEIELTIPGSIAYSKMPQERRSMSSGQGVG